MVHTDGRPTIACRTEQAVNPTTKALWDDIGNYYSGDQRAWAFVNFVVNGLPYATKSTNRQRDFARAERL